MENVQQSPQPPQHKSAAHEAAKAIDKIARLDKREQEAISKVERRYANKRGAVMASLSPSAMAIVSSEPATK